MNSSKSLETSSGRAPRPKAVKLQLGRDIESEGGFDEPPGTRIISNWLLLSMVFLYVSCGTASGPGLEGTGSNV